MRIAIVTSTFKPELSGIAETVNKRVREISRIGGHETLILGPDYSPIRDILPDWERWIGPIYDRVRLETYPTTEYDLAVNKPDVRRIVHFWQYSLDQQIARFAPDIIHVDEPDRLFGMQLLDGYGRRVGVAYARRHGVPLTGMWHTDYIKYASVYLTPLKGRLILPVAVRLMAWIYNAYDVAICNSEEALRFMQRIGVRTARFLRSVGIDLENFHPISVPRNDGLIELLYVGRVTPEKNLPVLFQAFTSLQKQYPQVRLRVVGDGPILPQLREQYAGPRVVFDGKIDNAQLPGIYGAADIFINPSHTETFTQTALEAAACGLPIVVAAGGGNFETVREGINGEFFAPGSAEGLRQKLELLITEPERRRAYAHRSPELAAPFGVARVAREFLNLWEELRERKR